MPSEKEGGGRYGSSGRGIDAARGRVELAADLAEAAGDFALGQLGEVADRVEAPALERRGDLERGGELLERQRREETRLLSLRDDGRRVGQARGDARGELGRGDADARGQRGLFRGAQDVAGEGPLTPFPLPPAEGDPLSVGMSFQIEIHDALALVLHARRKHLGDFEQRLLRRALALAVAAARDELRDAGARLGQRHAGLDAGFARLARRGDDARGAAVALADGDGLVLELRLAAQPRGQGKERDEEAGDHPDMRAAGRPDNPNPHPTVSATPVRARASFSSTRRAVIPQKRRGARPVPRQLARAESAARTVPAAMPLTR